MGVTCDLRGDFIVSLPIPVKETISNALKITV